MKIKTNRIKQFKNIFIVLNLSLSIFFVLFTIFFNSFFLFRALLFSAPVLSLSTGIFNVFFFHSVAFD